MKRYQKHHCSDAEANGTIIEAYYHLVGFNKGWNWEAYQEGEDDGLNEIPCNWCPACGQWLDEDSGEPERKAKS